MLTYEYDTTIYKFTYYLWLNMKHNTRNFQVNKFGRSLNVFM